MKVEVKQSIKASRDKIWNIVTDIANAPKFIESINEVLIHDQGDENKLGLKWTETRILFGKAATETMTIVDVEKNSFYKTHAQSHGSIYESELRLQTDNNNENILVMKFEAFPQTIIAKIMNILLGWMIKSATKKALSKDLLDIKAAAER